jgi:hypothetical protein
MELKDALTIAIGAAGVTVAFAAAVKAIVEYQKQGITKRAEIFLQMRSRLKQDSPFNNICLMLETDDKALKEVSIVEKGRFIGFFEEFSLLKNSGFINEHVSFYMFGYFAVKCLESENFWLGLNKDEPLWSLFRDFANQMKKARGTFKYDGKKLHL